MNASDETLLQQCVRTMQIIAGAMLLGVLVFLGYCLYSVLLPNGGPGPPPPPPPAPALPVLSIAGAAMLVVCALLSFVIAGVQTRAGLQQIVAGARQSPAGANAEQTGTVTGKLLAVWQTVQIVGFALLEGPAMAACAGYLLERQDWSLGVAGIAIVLMLLKFPTEGKVRSWLEQQAVVLAGLRQEKDIVRER